MTLEKLLTLVDASKQNELNDDLKIRWVCDVEGRVLTEIHGKSPDEIHLPDNPDDMLTIPESYGRVYVLYLSAMIEFSLGNYAAFDKINREFESALAMYARYYIRSRK